jgi:hypothetical protein
MDTTPSLPFNLSCGFALSTKTIGFTIAIQSVYSMIVQLCLFPILIKRLRTLVTFRMVLIIWPLLYLLVPYLLLLPEKFQTPGIYLCFLNKISFQVITFPSNVILLNNAVSSKKGPRHCQRGGCVSSVLVTRLWTDCNRLDSFNRFEIRL